MQTNIDEAFVESKIKEISTLQDSVLTLMVSLIEFRDEYTGTHLKRTQYFLGFLADELAKKEKYKELLNQKNIDNIIQASLLHDIGKIAIPDHILLKPGRLEPEEIDIMRMHSKKGVEILMESSKDIQRDAEWFNYALEIVEYHHEHYDGSGYPNGISGEDIPLSARLMGVADVYDALTSKRVYKKGFSHQEAMQIIIDDSGTHFDPEIVEAFIACAEQFVYISQKLEQE